MYILDVRKYDRIHLHFITNMSISDRIGKAVSQSDWFGLDVNHQV